MAAQPFHPGRRIAFIGPMRKLLGIVRQDIVARPNVADFRQPGDQPVRVYLAQEIGAFVPD